MPAPQRFAREALLWLGGVLGALCLASFAVGWLLHVTPLVFSSGSMSPVYDAGALGIAREVSAADLAVGDVVSVVDEQGHRVTHRIVGLEAVGSDAVLTLQGDTNSAPDARTYRVETADRVAFGIPYAGYVLNAAASPAGIATGALFVGGLLLLAFGRERAKRVVPAGIATAAVAGLGLGVSGAVPWAFTSAYWTDTASATVQASTPAALHHTQPICDSKNKNPGKYEAILTWPSLGPQYEYYWEVYQVGQSVPYNVEHNTGTIADTAPTVTLTGLEIVSGGGGNADYYIKIQTRLQDGHVDVGPATITDLTGDPLPGGAFWAMYCR